jgi:glutaminyl-tRNA synthetase
MSIRCRRRDARHRGTLTEPGKDSPYRSRSAEENLDLFRGCAPANSPTARMCCARRSTWPRPTSTCATRDLPHPPRTPHRTGDTWCIYPMYTYAHPIEDAIEHITHSICTLEFEDQRPFYDWLLDKLADGGLLAPLPQQIEFARLNLTYVVLSKRKLIQLVDEKHVDGWDDPRLPTLVGARRRGYTPEGFRRFAERIGVSKSDSWIDYSVLEECMRDAPERSARTPHRGARSAEAGHRQLSGGQSEDCFAGAQPPAEARAGQARRCRSKGTVDRARGLHGDPAQGLFPPVPGNKVRLRYGYVVECTGCDKDADGTVTAVHCEYLPDTKSGTPGADKVKVKGNIHWVSAAHAYAAEVRLYDRLFR